jgi:tetratricopeptide (TPR) repeat protein
LYFPHNWHFLAATAALEGRGARSIEAAFQTAAVIDQHYLREEGFETTQHYITIPYHVLVKFAQWEKLSVLPAPAKDLKYPTAMWHYVRGMAYANLGNLQKANDELEALKQLAVDESIRNTLIWEINTAADICLIAVHVLSGELHRISGKKEQAIKDFRTGISIEDKLNYNEPPDWFFSVRHYLGDVLLEMGRDAEAEVIYREDLTYWVKNGFALNGLYHSLLQQGKTEEATFVQHQFTEAWQRADSKLRYSRIDEESRTDLAIKLAPQSAPALVYLAGTMCLK